MRKNWLLLGIALLIAVLAIGVIACGDDDDAPTGDEPADDILVDDSNVVIFSAGVLSDSEGNTLYVSDDDEAGVSNCTDDCVFDWPPFTLDGDPVAGEGVGTLATIKRDDGITQVTHNDRPLYYSSLETGVGDQAGDGVRGVWHVVRGGDDAADVPVGLPDGETNTVIVTDGVLTDSAGNTLYIFDADEAGVSNCTEGCADLWPPLTVDGDAMAGDGVDGALGTITRDDGSTQVTHDDQPLYYFSGDDAAGDRNGDGFGDVWHVVAAGE